MKSNKTGKRYSALFLAFVMILMTAVPAFAETQAEGIVTENGETAQITEFTAEGEGVFETQTETAEAGDPAQTDETAEVTQQERIEITEGSETAEASGAVEASETAADGSVDGSADETAGGSFDAAASEEVFNAAVYSNATVTALSDAQVSTEAVLKENLQNVKAMKAGTDYDPDSAYCLANSREEAERIAKTYGITLASFEYGVAKFTFQTEVSPAGSMQAQTGNRDVVSVLESMVNTMDTVAEASALTGAAAGQSISLSSVASVRPDLAKTLTEAQVSELPDLPIYPNLIYHAMTIDPSDEPLYGRQWFHDAIDAEKAWATGADGKGVKVAVLDSGFDTKNNDIKGDVKSVGSYSSGQDENGHGTHCVGIVAGLDNTVGGLGVAPEASILSVRVLNKKGSGYTSDIVKGVNYAVEQGADVISMSLGGAYPDYNLQKAVTEAYDKGVVVIAAAGNSGVSSEHYPGAYENVICVGAYDKNGKLASYSNYGDWVDLAAPGSNVLSAMVVNKSAYLRQENAFGNTVTNGCSYGELSGTSMATPVVSGVAALILSVNPSLTPSQVESIILKSAADEKFSYNGRSVSRGVNAYQAVLAAGASEPAPKEEIPDQILVKGQKLDGAVLMNVKSVKGIKYRSADKNVASVNKNGIVTGGKNAGSTKIEAYTSKKKKGKTETTVVEKFTVYNEVPKFTTLKGTRTDLTYDMTASVSGLSKAVITSWSAATPKIASIDQSTGVATVLKAGTAKFKATFGSGKLAKTYQVSLVIKIPKMSKKTLKLKTGASATISIGNTSVTPAAYDWWVDDSSMADIVPNGKKCKITAKSLGENEKATVNVSVDIDGVSYSCAVTVKAPKISPATKTIKAGKSFTVKLTNTNIKSS
ncbi:MAG: S8 family serine peptidase, partial [Lachnospiraceae bacterium]|nr:S8 family serine peptidase [Lachnospiraceae bacterium]